MEGVVTGKSKDIKEGIRKTGNHYFYFTVEIDGKWNTFFAESKNEAETIFDKLNEGTKVEFERRESNTGQNPIITSFSKFYKDENLVEKEYTVQEKPRNSTGNDIIGMNSNTNATTLVAAGVVDIKDIWDWVEKFKASAKR